MAGQKRSGLGRGLGELFQPTDPETVRASKNVSRETDEEAPKMVDVSRETFTLKKKAGAKKSPHAASTHPASTRRASTDTPPEPLTEMPSGAEFSEIPVSAIAPNPAQPRQVFDEEQLDELAASITEVGLLQPIIVRRTGDGYELVMGERRWRATQQAGLETIPAIIRPTEEHDMLRDALLENLHRVQLNPLEEAAAYQQLLEDFACTQEELADRIKRSRSQIANTIRLLKLPPTVQRRVAAGVLSAGHARALLGLTNSVAQEQLAQRIVAEGLSVRATEELVTLNDSLDTPRVPRPRRERSERAIELSDSLSDYFETKAKVDIGRKNRGKITIEFANEDDLERILNIMRPQQ
ncbi:ParB/RepB/Spo0J family partition protein [Enemella sp. A6]|uniref:ParB/RepB/Spo0J family partition protein n=1 Tax=Enemella sp. A6 TaxID=3440152 RepID=UPI003EBB891B